MEQAINFNWHFIKGFSPAYQSKIPPQTLPINLPHNMVDFPFNNFSDIHHQVVGTYFKHLHIPDYDPELSYFIQFNGVMVTATVYVNGKEVGKYSHGYLPFEVDITNYVTQENNLLVVKVDGRENNEIPPWGNVVDYLSFSGIYRGVKVFSRQALDILSARVDGTLNGEVIVRPTFCNDNAAIFTAIYQVYDEDNKLLIEKNLPRFTVPQFQLWTLENPHLYRLNIILTSIDNKVRAEKSFTLAFRSVEAKPKGLYLNNQYVKLVGLNRHETYPYIGGAATKSLQEDDVKILKNLGVNYVRCSHYPPSEDFLDACDRYGILVMDEIPGWQHIGDKKWQAVHLDNIKRMITRDYNHPSIFSWSIRINESADNHDLYEKGQKLAKKLDPYRPTTGVRNFKNSELLEDMYSYNDFSHHGPNKGLLRKNQVTKTEKPYMVTECNGHMFPTKVYDGPEKQIAFVKRHLSVLDSAYQYQDIIGISPWCMHDYYTHQQFGSGDHICYHGILDSYRNPKLVSYAYQALLSDEVVMMPTFSVNNGDIPEAKLMPFYVLSNVAYIELSRGHDLIKKFTPRHDLFPHLKNPPFVIDYFIRENFLAKFKTVGKTARTYFGKILNYAALHGLNNIRLHHRLFLGYMMLRYHINYQDLVEIWGENVTSWGSDNGVLTLKGYNEHGELLATRTLGPSLHYHYDVKVSSNKLINQETYDTTKIVITSLDSNLMRNPYDASPVSITSNGLVTVLGPALQSLHGGALTIYVASLLGKGKGSVNVTLNNQIYSFDFDVE